MTEAIEGVMVVTAYPDDAEVLGFEPRDGDVTDQERDQRAEVAERTGDLADVVVVAGSPHGAEYMLREA